MHNYQILWSSLKACLVKLFNNPIYEDLKILEDFQISSISLFSFLHMARRIVR